MGVLCPVPFFIALKRVQDKLAASETLTELGLPQPETHVVATAEELAAGPVPELRNGVYAIPPNRSTMPAPSTTQQPQPVLDHVDASLGDVPVADHPH